MSLPNINPLRVASLGLALEGPVRPKRRTPPSIRQLAAKLLRVAKKAPEVVVRVSGSGKSNAHSLAHLTYITRNGKLAAENERGEKIVGRDAVKDVFEEWGFHTACDSERKRAPTINIVLSMPQGTDPQVVLSASRDFAAEEFSRNHQYLLALHEDTDHPHVHLTVKTQGFDLTWLRRTKADLQLWREHFAQKLRDQGIEAEATPRRARGVIQRPKTLAMRHMLEEKRSLVSRAKVESAMGELLTRTGQAAVVGLRPWETAILKRQREVRGTYISVLKDLQTLTDVTSRDSTTQLVKFLKGLPPIQTERHRLKRELAATIEARWKELGGREPEVL
jgi:hypothetical protein